MFASGGSVDAIVVEFLAVEANNDNGDKETFNLS